MPWPIIIFNYFEARPETPRPSDFDKFLKPFTDSELGKYVGTVGKIVPYVSAVLGVLEFFSERESPEERMLNRIDALHKAVEAGFKHLGEMLQYHTTIILDEVKETALQQAEAHTEAAMLALKSYTDNGQHGHLEHADAISADAVGFFKSQHEPLYLIGMAHAGNVRLDVLHHLYPATELDAFRRREIEEMAAGLTRLIEAKKHEINASHVVGRGPTDMVMGRPREGHNIRPETEGDTEFSVPTYRHANRGRDVVVDGVARQSWPTIGTFGWGRHARHWADGSPESTEGFISSELALAAAERSRTSGVQGQLKYFMIPEFEKLRDRWLNFAQERQHARAAELARLLIQHRPPDLPPIN